MQELDEDAALLAADGVAEETDGGYRIDARDVVDTSEDVDAVKVLGSGQVRNELELVADGFSENATEKVEAAGGSVELTELGEKRQAEDDTSDEEE